MTGNMAAVRDAFRSGALKKGDVIGYEDRDPLFAEILPDVRPQWHVLTVEPARERTAVAHLVGRRFGIYLPEMPAEIKRCGKVLKFMRPMCPGYVFAYVWDIERHRDRLLACVGVTGILRMADDATIASPYAIVPDAVIDRMRAEENLENPLM